MSNFFSTTEIFYFKHTKKEKNISLANVEGFLRLLRNKRQSSVSSQKIPKGELVEEKI